MFKIRFEFFELLSSPALIGLIGFNCMPPRAPTTSSNAETKNIINDLAIFLKLFTRFTFGIFLIFKIIHICTIVKIVIGQNFLNKLE